VEERQKVGWEEGRTRRERATRKGINANRRKSRRDRFSGTHINNRYLNTYIYVCIYGVGRQLTNSMWERRVGWGEGEAVRVVELTLRVSLSMFASSPKRKKKARNNVSQTERNR
jgi:hypothetical protein